MDASGNKFGPEGGKAIAEALQTNTTIATIILNGTNDTTITVRADQLRQNTVDSLDFSNQGLHVDGATFVVAELLKSNSSVTKVSMTHFLADVACAAAAREHITRASLRATPLRTLTRLVWCAVPLFCAPEPDWVDVTQVDVRGNGLDQKTKDLLSKTNKKVTFDM